MNNVAELNIKVINLLLQGERELANAIFKDFTGIDLERGRGELVCKSMEVCQGCGDLTEVLFFERCVVNSYCNDCDQRILQEIHAHEMGLISSGYYG